MAKKILVTGGAGFIGTHLCKRLTQAGHKVTVLDLKSPPHRVPGVTYHRGDVRIEADLEGPVAEADVVYHYAAIVSVPLCEERPDESHQTNFIGTCKVLEAIRASAGRRKQPARIVFASSAAVYGHLGKAEVPLSEESHLPTPLSLYAAQKLFSEIVIRMYHEKHGVPATVFRFFNVFGPGQDPSSPYSGVISIFDRLIREGKPLALHGGGKQTRDFVSVHDLADANVKALDVSDDKADGQPINLGGGTTVTVARLAEEMMQVAGNKVPVQTTPPRVGDVQHSFASITRAANVLGWKPKRTLVEGLTELRLQTPQKKAA